MSPDFVKAPIKKPSERTNKPDWKSFQKTTNFVQKYMPDITWSDNIIENSTCLATMVPDGGFILDFAPANIVPHHEDIIIFAAVWGFKFVPFFGQILADLAIKESTSYNITSFRINRPGILKPTNNHATKSSNRDVCLIVVVLLCVFLVAILIAITVKICCCYRQRRTYQNLDNISERSTKV